MISSESAENPIRVLQCVPRTMMGGVFVVARELVNSFSPSSLTPRRIHISAAVTPEKSYSGEFILTHDSSVHITAINGNLLRRVRTLLRVARSNDIIHVHGFTPWEALACWMSGKPIVFTNHGLLGVGRRLRPYEHIKKVLLKIFLRHACSRIVSVSSYGEKRLLDEYRVDRKRSIVIHNSTAWTAVSPSLHSWSEECEGEKFTLGYHGRFVQFKRLDRFINVASKVHHERKIKVKFVGDGPLRESLSSHAKRQGVDLEIIPFCHDPQIKVQQFSAELITSDEEYFGLSVLESIQSGHPTFVFADGGGCTEIFDPESAWFVCANEDEMAHKISDFRRDHYVRSLALKKLEHLQERVTTEFSSVRFAEKYLAVYASLQQEEPNS